MVQFHGITALLILKCITLNYGLVEEHGRAGRVLLKRFFPTFIFVPHSDACALHMQILDRVREGPKKQFMGQKTCF